MKKIITLSFFAVIFSFSTLATSADHTQHLPDAVKNIMRQARYNTANWSIYVKDLATQEVPYRQNTTGMFIPASVCKLFSVAALLQTFGDDYTFQTPVYLLGKMDADGVLNGDLVLVAKGDLTLGGRHLTNNTIAYTDVDHIDANHVPGATLTTPDPLAGIKSLAKQIHAQGIKAIKGNILIDTRLFDIVKKRENVISPIMINDNLIDIEVTPAELDKTATLNWRPQLSSLRVINKVVTVPAGQESNLAISANEAGNEITVTGRIALDQKNIVNTFTIENPEHFAEVALLDALQHEGIQVKPTRTQVSLPDPKIYSQLKPVATITSEPMLEYAKLILKVSHNLGANLVPLLLASYHGQTSDAEGMRYIGKFITDTAHIDPAQITFGDAAGGNDNYATPEAIMQLLTYDYKVPPAQFEKTIYTLPILGVDGSLASLAKQTPAKGHVYAKTGTGIIYNALQGSLFLSSKSIAGYMLLNNHHWVAFSIIVNGSVVKDIAEVLAVNDDIAKITSEIYATLNKA